MDFSTKNCDQSGNYTFKKSRTNYSAKFSVLNRSNKQLYEV
ncbi:uncharacterized protein METZ01_LOCUS206232 [marine metagenome]|uniref:Uncharacterized protein n=1 Tax=marine metagenome TaxID=408172 RepID=A0A382ERS5_9ZZZZ